MEDHWSDKLIHSSRQNLYSPQQLYIYIYVYLCIYLCLCVCIYKQNMLHTINILTIPNNYQYSIYYLSPYIIISTIIYYTIFIYTVERLLRKMTVQ